MNSWHGKQTPPNGYLRLDACRNMLLNVEFYWDYCKDLLDLKDFFLQKKGFCVISLSSFCDNPFPFLLILQSMILRRNIPRLIAKVLLMVEAEEGLFVMPSPTWRALGCHNNVDEFLLDSVKDAHLTWWLHYDSVSTQKSSCGLRFFLVCLIV